MTIVICGPSSFSIQKMADLKIYKFLLYIFYSLFYLNSVVIISCLGRSVLFFGVTLLGCLRKMGAHVALKVEIC